MKGRSAELRRSATSHGGSDDVFLKTGGHEPPLATFDRVALRWGGWQPQGLEVAPVFGPGSVVLRGDPAGVPSSR
ncbi:MAG: hypothetical protein M2R45_01978 [Verrucomicrobia subdivision 3 bacterium]|nr:hypothetical protein [Limisphaerales bacterium]MCS1416155.1 hypothetical protein [Limisphaerales bacterium]